MRLVGYNWGKAILLKLSEDIQKHGTTWERYSRELPRKPEVYRIAISQVDKATASLDSHVSKFQKWNRAKQVECSMRMRLRVGLLDALTQ